MEVGVREFKAHLSEYLRRVAGGEFIVVTDRGVPAAVLGPVPGRSALDQGIREGWISPPTGRGLTPFSPVTSSRRSADVLTDDRGT